MVARAGGRLVVLAVAVALAAVFGAGSVNAAGVRARAAPDYLGLARDRRGLFTRRWNGAFASNDRLLTDAGTLMLFAAGHVVVRATRLASRPVYALRLGDGAPLVELLVDRGSLRPVGARYVSRTTAGSSELLPAIRLRRSRPTGC